jgi:hypothetical protein
MVQPCSNSKADQLLLLVLQSKNRGRRLWKLLLKTLMWSSLIERDQRGFEETMELPLMED